MGIKRDFLGELADVTIPTLSDIYPELEEKRDHILGAMEEEETRFQRTLRRGEKEFHKAVELCRSEDRQTMPGRLVFRLYDTYGFPPELTQELAQREGLIADMEGYELAVKEH